MPPTTAKPPTAEIGHVATSGAVVGPSGSMLSGTLLDPAEETAAWQWPQSIRTADTLIKNSQVQAVMWAVTLPIRRPSIWALDPRRASDEVVRFVAEDLDLPILGDDQPKTPPARSKGRLSWVDHMRMALLDLRYGAMAFQQVYTEPDAAGRFHLRKLSPRMPHTWASIDVDPDGSLKGISQWRLAHEPGKPSTIPIPVDWLVMYTNEREGANWAGRSILRSCYGDYVLLDRQVRVRAQTNERNGMGVPIFEPDKDAQPTQAQIDAAAEMAQAYRAGEFSGGAGIPGFHFRVVGVEGTLPDIGAAISDHRTQIARSVLAHVMQLGLSADSSGNRALGGTFLDQFTMVLDSIAGTKADVATAHIVEDIVDINWGPDEPAPAVVAQPVDAERDISPESLAALVREGVLDADDELQAFTRQRHGIPRRPVVEANAVTPGSAEAVGALIRAGFSPAAALEALGLPPIDHTGLVPVTVQRPAAAPAAPVAARRRVAASAPGGERYEDELTSFYAPRIAEALVESTDVGAIVAAMDRDRQVAAARAVEVERRTEDREMQITTLIGAVSAMAARPHPEPVINVAAPAVTVTPPSVTVEAPHITVEAPTPTSPPARPKNRRIERNAAGDITRIVEE